MYPDQLKKELQTVFNAQVQQLTERLMISCNIDNSAAFISCSCRPVTAGGWSSYWVVREEVS